MKKNEWWFNCPRCKAEKASKHMTIPCKKCLNSKEYKKEIKQINDKPVFFYRRYSDVKALGLDKSTGEPIGIGKHGKRVKLSDTRYNEVHRDPHGWKATGKKVRDTDQHGRKVLPE